MQATAIASAATAARPAADPSGVGRAVEKGAPALNFAELLIGAAELEPSDPADDRTLVTTDDTAGANQEISQTTAQETPAGLTLLQPPLTISDARSHDLRDSARPLFTSAEKQVEDPASEPSEATTPTDPGSKAWLATLLQHPSPAGALANSKGISKPAAGLNSGVLDPRPERARAQTHTASDLEAKDALLTVTAQRQPAAEAPMSANQTMALVATNPNAAVKPAASSLANSNPLPVDTYQPLALQSPGFASAFSARVATLVRDGVEHARVHLNPVEMGPVSMRLSLDGQQVRVDMTAEVAATRQVLEQALPALAGALREVGFMLSGGGVHQPSAEARAPTGQDSGTSSTSQSSGTLGQSAGSASGGSPGGAGPQDGQPQPTRQGWLREGGHATEHVIAVGGDGGETAVQLGAGSARRPGTRLVDTFA